MTIVNIFIYNKESQIKLKINESITKIKIYIKNKSFNSIDSELNKIYDIVNTISKKKKINIFFDKSLEDLIINSIITKLNNFAYSYKSSKLLKKIKLHNIKSEGNILMNELTLYKNIIMDPNKNPETYLLYIKSRIPKNYKLKCFNINKSNKFPLSKAVGLGSSYDSYFIHILPKKENNKNKSIYLIGKSITFDSGGLNLKSGDYSEMKIDMTGSALVLSVLNLLADNNYDSKYNIHIVFSIVENMISNKATRPGMVITTMSNRTIEIKNTDAEGRLCLVDAIDYINLYLINNKNSIVIDVATLTGNAEQITNNLSSIATSNEKGLDYLNQLIKIGESTGEYLDYLKIRQEYLSLLNSTVADIKNISNTTADCIIAATFLSYFTQSEIPWIHIDLGGIVFKHSKVVSYGVNLLYEFIKQL
jgi:leucyl aminopeptidase